MPMRLNNNSGNQVLMPVMTTILLVTLTTAIIVWFLPNKPGIVFSYEPNKPWVSGTLISEFRFPIIKSDEAMAVFESVGFSPAA